MKYFFIIAFTLQLSIIHCQSTNNTSWTLEQCIDSALVNNYKIKTVDINSNKAIIQLKQTKYNSLPSLNAGATHGYNWGQTIDPFTNQFATSRVQYDNFYLVGSLVLFSGLQNYYGQKMAEQDWESQVYNKKIEERNLKIEIVSAYLQVLLNDEIVKINKEQLALTVNLKERMSTLVANKIEPKYKLLDLKAQEQMEQYNILKAQNDVNYSLLLLQQLMNMSYDSSFKILSVDTLMNNELNIERIDISQLPDIQLINLSIIQQDLKLKQMNAKRLPSLTLNGSLGTGYSENNKYLTPNGELIPKPFQTQINGNFYQSASLTLTIPLYNKHQNITQKKIIQLEEQQILLNKEKLTLDLENKINRLKMDVENYSSQIKALKLVLNAQQVAYNNSEIQFEKGFITNNQLLEVKTKLFQAKSELIQSKYKLIASQTILSFYRDN
jgi:outer membrane protein